MKKTACMFLFFLFIFLFCQPTENKKIAFGFSQNVIKVQNGEEIYNFDENVLISGKLTKEQKKIREGKEIEKIKKLGFTEEESIRYVFPECETLLNLLVSRTNKKTKKEDEIFFKKNTCELIINEGEEQEFIDKEMFYKDFLRYKNKEIEKIEVKIKKEEKKTKKNVFERGCFSTNFSSSSEERKNNIKKAVECFDGICLEVGEILSFNETTGVRNEEKGYKKAKIISGGTFVEGFGGGVCQVSTTLYNTCLLSGLEIVEVHQHSLPVSYVDAGFDAMVNLGSSDFVFRNNTEDKIYITSSYKDDVCKFKIFGEENKYKIERKSEKVKKIDAFPDEILKNEELSKQKNLEIGEELRLSYAKDGFVSNSYLVLYDKNGKLIKKEKIRTNRYEPTRGIILKR